MLWVVPLLAQAQPALEPEFTPASPRLGDLVRVQIPVEPQKAQADAHGSRGTIRAFFCEHPLIRSRSGWAGYVAVPSDTSTGTHTLRFRLADRTVQAPLTVVDRDFDESTLRVAPRFTKKRSPELQARLDREQARFDAVWSSAASQPRSAAPLLAVPEPPARGRHTGRFGTRRVFNGSVKSVHYGLDISAPTGRPVVAAWDGRVALVGHMWGSGKTVVLDHGLGLFSAYYHLSRIGVSADSELSSGDRLGSVGATGRVTGPHLHWAVAVQCRQATGPDAGKWRSMYVDPEPLLESTD